MQKTYQRIAEGIKKLKDEIKPNDIVIPIGLDGAILYHLLVNCYDKTDTEYTDFLKNTCNLSSKTETYSEKFENLLLENREKTIYALDMRTDTGRLGEKLRGLAGDSSLRYAVLFDSNGHANWCAFNEAFEERIIWLSKKDYENLNVANITHKHLEKIPTVKEIKKYLA
ncbi:MAG: hypothetical protein KAI53_02805 [Candidatus Aenigmarchaeota archaeon]|nr:hypothetical protein [Candidatus Aenigmarchaeota archaeon]